MSWFKNIVRPKIATRQKRDVPAELWQKCPSCGDMLYREDMDNNLSVCPGCHHHLRLNVSRRLDALLDKQGRTTIDLPKGSDDPLNFKDSKKYTDRLKASRQKTGHDDVCRVISGSINGQGAVVCAFDFSFMGGSMGVAVGSAIVKAAEVATKENKALLLIPASGGARMQEGILSLMQMARTTAALANLKDAGLPYIVLLTDPTTGGVSASFAMQGDYMFAEPGALIGFAGPRVIEQTIGEVLPEGFQTAEYLLKHGMIDDIAARNQQRQKISTVIKHLTAHQ